MGRGGQTVALASALRGRKSINPVEHDHSCYLDYDYLNQAKEEMEFEISEQVMLAGDIHGDIAHLEWLARRAKRTGCSTIIQVGDLGYWPHSDPKFLRTMDKLLERHNLHLFALDGNHENFSALKVEHPEHEQFRVLGKRVLHLPRGASWSWHGRKFISLGGAHSTDKDWRLNAEQKRAKAHQRSRWFWWPEEDISATDVARAQAQGKADILLTHDAPLSVHLPIPYREDPQTMSNRQELQRVLETVRPDLVYHGHYHTRYSGTGGGFDWATQVEGLGRNTMAEESCLFLDLTA